MTNVEGSLLPDAGLQTSLEKSCLLQKKFAGYPWLDLARSTLQSEG